MTSIIMTYHEEPVEFIRECVDQLQSTIDITDYELIIVDDCSQVPLPLSFNDKKKGVRVIRNATNIGVGRSFDAGVKEAKGENIILMACDIRFKANNWASLLIQEIDKYPTSFICTSCVCLDANNMDFDKRQKENVGRGATILMYHDKESNPLKDARFKSIIEAKWQGKQKGESYEIPCILGAFYGVKKAWYEHVDGFWGHIRWGTLEPYISLKSWFFGGSCRIATHIYTAHIFSDTHRHGIKWDVLMYNKMLVSTLLFKEPLLITSFIPESSIKETGRKMIYDNREEIMKKREEYLAKRKVVPQSFFDKWKIDTRGKNLR